MVLLSGCGGSRSRWDFPPHFPRHWAIPSNVPDAALITFHFPPPNDIYGGEVRRAEGRLLLPDADRPGGGWFRVAIADVDMGEDDLSQNVRFAAEMLHGTKYPFATFTIRGIAFAGDGPNGNRRATGHADRPVILIGDFELKGVTVPLEVGARLAVCSKRYGTGVRPVFPSLRRRCRTVSADRSHGLQGQVRDSGAGVALELSGEFQLERIVSTFNVFAPASDEPDADRVTITFRFALTPEAPSAASR